jgi:flavin-dependent dehydrogenase
VADAQTFGRAAARDPLAFFRSMLRRFPALPHRLTDARIAGASLLHGDDVARQPTAHVGLLASGPFDVPTRRIAGSGWVLVGDAAGYFDPFTGQGIHHAMRGACLLADAILAAHTAVARERALATYVAEHRRMTRPARALQGVIDAVLRRPDLADFAIRRLAAAPDAARAILAATGDLRSPGSLLSPGLALSLAVPSFRRVRP